MVAGYSWNGANFDMAVWRYLSTGAIDTTFGTNGVVISDNAAGGHSDDVAAGIAIDAAGNILVTGYSWNAAATNNKDMVIWRFNSGGVADSTFGTNGVVISDNAAGGQSNDGGSAIAVDSIGRIVVAGQSTGPMGNNDMAVWRYKSDGTPDTTFGVNGVAVHNGAAGKNGNDSATSLVLDTVNNKIVVAGYSYDGLYYDIVVWRFNP